MIFRKNKINTLKRHIFAFFSTKSTFVIDSNHRNATQALILSPRIKLIAISLALVLFMGCLTTLSLTSKWIYVHSAFALSKIQNQYLKSSISLNTLKNQSLLSQLDSLKSTNDALTGLFGLKDETHGFQFGQGGRLSPDEFFLFELKPINKEFKLLDSVTKSVQFELKMSEKQSNRLIQFIDYKQKIWDHTPTIKPSPGKITSHFGYRIHPVTQEDAMHLGIDIAAPKWSPIYATANGTVVNSVFNKSFGNLIVIDHGNGFTTNYAHLSKKMVQKGQMVSRNDLIGYMGQSGLATGNHLHYEVHRDKNAKNPMNFILPSGVLVD